MSSTSEEILAAANVLIDLTNTTLAEMNAIQARIDALMADPSVPDAKQQYEQIKADRSAMAKAWNSSSTGLDSAMISLYNDGTSSAKASTNDIVSNAQNQMKALLAQGVAQKEQALPALLAAIESANASGNQNPDNKNEDGATQTKENKLTGSADGDSVNNPGSTTAGTANDLGKDSVSKGYNAAKDSAAAYDQAAATGNTSAGGPSNVTKTNSPSKPGKRLQNPLGDFSSYTYQLSLYMLSPDAYNQFVQTGRKNINILNNIPGKKNGTFTLVQSGGINNTVSARATGFELDLYIDDLKVVSKGTNNTTVATIAQEYSFNIYEPYGFSFPSKLRAATLELAKNSNIKDMDQSSNALKQHYVLGIRFQGYDKDGKLVTASDFFSKDTARPGGKGDGVFERFLDIKITSFKFKLDGKMSIYQVTGMAVPMQEAMTLNRGRIDVETTVTAKSVGDALDGPDGLLTKLNKQQEQLAKTLGPDNKPSIGVPNKYKVAFLGDASMIKDAKIVTPSDGDKSKLPMTNIKNSDQSTDAVSIKAAPDFTKKNVIFARDTSIQQAINNLITQSTYVEDAMKMVYTDSLEPSSDPNNPDAIKQPKSTKLQWYTLSAYVEVIAWDAITNQWAYEITYVIQPYLASSVVSPYSAALPKYPGPFKRYDYWYTGKNSEVISFEQQIDQSYLSIALAAQSTPSSKDAGYSYKAGIPQNEDRTGAKNEEREAQNSIATSIYAPTDWAKSKITIMGDPDYLMQPAPPAPGSATTNYDQFYGPDGYSINPMGSQNFIEIDFKEGVDYKLTDGLMSINDSLTFWQSPDRNKNLSAKGVKGLSFFIEKIESFFQKGKFTQTLSLRRNTFPELDQTEANKTTPTTATDKRESSTSSDTTTSPTSANTKSDIKTDPGPPTVGTSAASSATGNVGATTPNTQTTSGAGTKAVADDEASTNKGTTTAGTAAAGGREEPPNP